MTDVLQEKPAVDACFVFGEIHVATQLVAGGKSAKKLTEVNRWLHHLVTGLERETMWKD